MDQDEKGERRGEETIKDLQEVWVKTVKTCSLQPLGLPAANPAYPLTCSNPAQGLSFLLSKTTNTKTLKPKTLKPKFKP